MEYGFGAHEYPTSGIFEVEPRNCPGFIFRRSILLGSTNMSGSEFRSFMECLSSKYHGDSYHLIAKNCNHFTDEVCQELTGKPIPAWINRLARVGENSLCIITLVVDNFHFFLSLCIFTMNSTCSYKCPCICFKLHFAVDAQNKFSYYCGNKFCQSGIVVVT